MADDTELIPRVFFIVGRARWGKSWTFRALTGGLQRSTQIRGLTFVVKRRSNDDIDGEWLELIDGLDPDAAPYVLVAMCPEMDTLPALERMRRRGYQLFFWVIGERSDGGRGRTITEDEVSPFGRLGLTEFCRQPADEGDRAKQLKAFIEDQL